jgi:hypothetical protein
VALAALRWAPVFQGLHSTTCAAVVVTGTCCADLPTDCAARPNWNATKTENIRFVTALPMAGLPQTRFARRDLAHLQRRGAEGTHGPVATAMDSSIESQPPGPRRSRHRHQSRSTSGDGLASQAAKSRATTRWVAATSSEESQNHRSARFRRTALERRPDEAATPDSHAAGPLPDSEALGREIVRAARTVLAHNRPSHSPPGAHAPASAVE